MADYSTDRSDLAEEPQKICERCGVKLSSHWECHPTKETLEREAREKAERFVDHVLGLHGVRTVRFRDGSKAILDQPGKWCSIVGCLHDGLILALAGEGLPKFKVEEPPPRPPRPRRCTLRKNGRRCTKAHNHEGTEHVDVRGNKWEMP